MVEYISKIPERPALVSRDAHRKAWISVTAPEKSELAILAKKYDLDADTLFDIFDDDEVTRLEHLDGHDYIFARFAVKTGDYSVATRPILLIASPNLTMTVAPEKPHIYDDMLKDHSHLDTSDSNEFVLYFLRHVVEDYTINLKQISHRIKQATEHLRAHRLERDDFVDFVSIEDDLSNILTSLAPIPPILKRLVDSEDTILNQAHARKAEDVSLAIEQSINTCNADLRRIVSVREAYSTISNNSLNGTMKTLTMVTLLIALPNVIFGMYGMNIGLPIQRETWAYFAVIGGTFLIVLVAYVIAKIKKVF